MSSNTNDMVFVLGYDLLQEKLTSFDDCPCDWAYEVCVDVYNEFLESEEAEQDKSEYECMQDWIENHQGTIDRFIEQNYRLLEEKDVKTKINKQKRIEVVRAMETLARSINDERVFLTWLSLGVADGDINENTSDEEFDFYIEEDKCFADLMHTFLRCMSNAYQNGGLYVDNVVSKEEE